LHAAATGLLLRARQEGDIDQLLHGAPAAVEPAGAGSQQQRRRSTALSSECGQCHVDS